MSVLHPIEEDPRFRVTTATDGQTAFTVPFYFQDNADVAVLFYAGGEGAGLELTEGVHYTLTGAGNNGGGTATLFTPAEAGDVVIRIGRAVLERVSDITVNGRFRSKAIDDDLDRFIIIALELARDLARAYKAPYGYSGGTIGPGGEGNTALFDAFGNLVDGPSGAEIASAEEFALQALAAAALAQAGAGAPIFASKAIAEAYSPISSPAFIDLAFYDSDRVPGSGGRYRKVNSEPSHEGKLSITQPDTTVVWYELAEAQPTPQMFGAKADGATDDTEAFERLFDYGLCCYLPAGEYVVTSLTPPEGTIIKTDGYPTKIKQKSGQPIGTRTINITHDDIQIGPALEGEGNIATDVNEQNHFIYIAGPLKNVRVGDVIGRNIRGDVVYIGGTQANPLYNVSIGNVFGDNVLRNVVSITGGQQIDVGQVSGSAVGFMMFDVEPDPGGQRCDQISVGHVRGHAVGVVGLPVQKDRRDRKSVV